MNAPLLRAAVPEPQDISASFKAAMRELAGGVAVITAGEGDERTGMTATSVTSLSVAPPTLLVCINQNASTWPAIRRWGSFGVNLIGADQAEVADRFTGRGGLKGAERYAGADWTRLVTGAPILSGALAALDCEVEETLDRHSHVIVIGRVRAVHVGGGEAASVYWRGRYLRAGA